MTKMSNGAALSRQTVLKIILLIFGIAIFLAAPISLPAQIGAIDFRPYWSSSFLLAHRQDFSDSSAMDRVERTQTGWDENYTMSAWFAPTGNLVLLPYTFFPFIHAVYYWLITNVAIVFFSALLIWRKTARHAWIPLVATFGFSMTLLSLIFGQVNTLIVFGLALFLFFNDSKRDEAMGASLVLTTIKPHLVILTLPILLLDLFRRKQWRALAGFASALAGCALVLFVFYPAWPISFWQLVSSGMGTARQTPTLAGLLVVVGQPVWAKWLWVFGLFSILVVWWRNRKEWDHRTLIDISVLAGMMVAPVGWSYDQIMLLFPLLRILRWSADGSLARKHAIIIVLALIVIDAGTFYQRIFSTQSDVWFFWVPFAVAAVYLLAWQRRQVKPLAITTVAT